MYITNKQRTNCMGNFGNFVGYQNTAFYHHTSSSF